MYFTCVPCILPLATSVICLEVLSDAKTSFYFVFVMNFEKLSTFKNYRLQNKF